MTSFLSLHAAATARGDGLDPRLLAGLANATGGADPANRHDRATDSSPALVSSECASASASLLPFLRRHPLGG
jgi:hypothetical protein